VGRIFGAPSRRQHRVFVGWRQVVAASRVRTAVPMPAWVTFAVSSDGNTWVWTLHSGAVCFFTRDRGATWTQARGIPRNTTRVIAQPRQSAEVLWAGPGSNGKLFTSTDGAATLLPSRPWCCRMGCRNPGGNRATTAAGRTGSMPHREGGRPLAGCVQRLVPFHTAPAGTLFEWVAPRSFTHSASAKPRQAPTTRRLYMIGVCRRVARAFFRSNVTGPAAGCASIRPASADCCCTFPAIQKHELAGSMWGPMADGTLYGDPGRRGPLVIYSNHV